MVQPVPNPESLGVPARTRSGTVGSWRSGRSEEFGSKTGTSSSKNSSVTSSLKSFASSFIPGRSHKPVSAPAPTSTLEPSPPHRELTPPRELTPTPPQTPEQGPTTIRLIPSPGPNALLPRSKSAADLLEGVPLATPALNKIATELAAAEEILNGEEDLAAGARVSFGFGTAGYDDGEEVGDISMASIGLPAANEGGTVPGGFLDNEELGAPNKPFVFGHPRHSVSNTQFGDAAAAVLREMNARMGVTSPDQAVSLGQLEGVMANVGKSTAPLRVEKKADVRFKGTHEKEFSKMDSIANHYSVHAKKRKSEHTTTAPTTAPAEEPADKIFTLPPHLATANEPERTSKRARISTADGSEHPNKSLADSPAVRAQLEKRRRSSAVARKSGLGAGARKSGAGAAAPKGGFGFMKMVRGFWGSKPKEAEKPKAPEMVKKQVEVVKKTDPRPEAKRFPNAPTHEPVVLPSAPKTRIEEKKAVGLGRPSGSGAGVVPKTGRVASEGGASAGTITKPRTGSSLYAPTAASLARQGAAVKPTLTVGKTSTVRSRAATMGTASTDGPKSATTRPLPVPPTNVGRATTSSAATQASARMASPPVRAASTAGLGRKSVARSPSGARKSIFTAPLTVDAMTMRGSAPTVQPFRLSPQGNLNPDLPAPAASTATASKPAVARASGATSPGTRLGIARIPPRAAPSAISKPPPTAARPPRRPRISRSKVIARLGEKRAAATVASPSNKALSPRGKARSSLQVRSSVGGVAAKRALEADKIRARRSEAVSRKARIVEDRGLVGRRSEGSVLKRR